MRILRNILEIFFYLLSLILAVLAVYGIYIFLIQSGHGGIANCSAGDAPPCWRYTDIWPVLIFLIFSTLSFIFAKKIKKYLI